MRSTPISEPRQKAITQDESAVAMVQLRPERSMSAYVPVPSGEGSRKMPQFQV